MADLYELELLIVEDNDQDLELALRALKKARISNRIEVVRDGAEALDFLFSENYHQSRTINNQPKLVC
jgi:two-component system response regulator